VKGGFPLTKKQKQTLFRIILSSLLTAIFNFLPISGIPRLLFFLLPYLLIGYNIFVSALFGIRNGQFLDENFLMVTATAGAFILAFIGEGDYTEAVAVMLFYQIGELFQSYAVGKSRRSISALMDIRPDYANIEENGTLIQVAPEEVSPGSLIVVCPGEKIPIDGIIEDGAASLNTAALTGESIPRDVAKGDEVTSGCVSLNGLLKIRTTREFGESAVSKILDLMENASSRKSKSEAFISRFARIYTPVVCILALLLALLPPLSHLLFSHAPPDWGTWLYRSLTFLVISCPCALVISIPLGFFAGLGGAGSAGILIKGSNYLEGLAKVGTVVFDKTGTLTKGSFQVINLYPTDLDAQFLLEYAALAESSSSHPIAQSLRAAFEGKIDRSRVSDVRELIGEGILACVDGIHVAVGNDRLMARIGISPITPPQPGVSVHVAVGKKYFGSILISDTLKPTSHAAVTALRSNGISSIVMLTGDSKETALQTAKSVGITEFHSQMLPADKVDTVEKILLKKPPHTSLLYVGDGINDAPVLARADIGIAMGAMGTDAAIEAADVVLMDDDPMKVAKAIRISRRCMSIIRQNIVFALTVKFLCLVLGALGKTSLWLAIFADVGVMVLAVLNAIRALHVKNL